MSGCQLYKVTIETQKITLKYVTGDIYIIAEGIDDCIISTPEILDATLPDDLGTKILGVQLLTDDINFTYKSDRIMRSVGNVD